VTVSSSPGVVALAGLIATAALTACSFGPHPATYRDQKASVSVVVLDEFGDPLPTATFTTVAGRQRRADALGVIHLELTQPVAGVVSAPERLSEPLAVAPTDGAVPIRLLDRVGPDGERTAIHFGGDTMLGRRYQEPIRSGTPLVDDEQSARDVVAELAPLLGAADLSVVNLETVVGSLPADEAYPGKRFLLQSPPLITAAIDALGVDLVTLANNHARDWLDAGVASTRAVLDDAGIPHVGAALDEDGARTGTVITVGGHHLGVVALDTVDGDGVNDLLPLPGDRQTTPDPASAWQYQGRQFGFGVPGEPGYMAPAARWPGAAWSEFQRLEPTLSHDRVAALWAALTAPGAFPELQDWVARRGHGGAGNYDRAALADEIQRLRNEGAEHVVVQFHGGFQFTAAPSQGLRSLSRSAIDAGADMVVSHHPHVLQGAEWYDGKLIVYSLGNLVFDQNFHVTYPTAFLRVVVDAGGLVEARFVPVLLDSYRPAPAAAGSAARIVRMLAARSLMGAYSAPADGIHVKSVQIESLPDGFQPAGVVLKHGTGEIVATPRYAIRSFQLERGVTPFHECVAMRVNDLPVGVEYGVDLLAWGSFDDGLADRQRRRPLHWLLPDTEDWELVEGEAGSFDDAIRLSPSPNKEVTTRYVSLIGRQEHEYWLADGSGPADAAPTYTVVMRARRQEGSAPLIILTAYRMADEDGTKEPDTTPLGTLTLTADVPADGTWHEVTVAVDPVLFQQVGDRPVDGVAIQIEAPPGFHATLDLDDVRLMEWRPAPPTPLPIWSEIDALRAATPGEATVPTATCSSD
jgi:poly-gamma-glutamate capsule biosynthesis protein CapA/YwtB (metallophosphatase superfamily)